MKRAKIYVASSWRNEYQQNVVGLLRGLGHEVYDFRNPKEGNNGFAWSNIDPNWENWSPEEYKMALDHPLAKSGFKHDFDAMKWAEVCVMVLPCGRSANTEAGWMRGSGRKVVVFQPVKCEPELMYKIYDELFTTVDELSKFFTNYWVGLENPHAAFGRRPHRMDFDSREEFERRQTAYDRWEMEENNNP